MDFENIEISISEKQKKEVKYLPFLELKNSILGKDYNLSIAFVNSKTALSINKKTRAKSYIPNTLSFPFSKNSGEIYLQLETIFSQAKDFELSKKDFLLKIYIHSLLHLKGLDHSSKMDLLEEKYLNKYRNIE